MRYKAIFGALAAAGGVALFTPVKDVAFDVLAYDIKDAPQERYDALAEGREYGATTLTALAMVCFVGCGVSFGAGRDSSRQAAIDAEKKSRSSSQATYTPSVELPENIDTPTYLRDRGLG